MLFTCLFFFFLVDTLYLLIKSSVENSSTTKKQRKDKEAVDRTKEATNSMQKPNKEQEKSVEEFLFFVQKSIF